MNAADRPRDSEGQSYPSHESVERLQHALSSYIRTQDETPVREALAVLAREARARQLYAERMLVAVKRVWMDTQEVKAMPNEKERRRILDHVVKLCISTYYES